MGRRFLLLLFIFISFSSFANAQASAKEDIVEGFNEWPVSDWDSYIMNQGEGFAQGTTDPHEGSGYLFHADVYGVEASDWFVSPKITVPVAGKVSFFEKNLYTDSPLYGEHGLYISTTGGNPNVDEFVKLGDFEASHVDWTLIEIALSDYVGQEVYFGFYYKGTYSTQWFIDEFTISTLPEYEVALEKSDMSTVGELNVEFTPSVNVVSECALNMTDIAVKLFIDDEEVEEKSISLESAETKKLEFSAITLTDDVDFKFVASFEGDGNAANNELINRVSALVKSKAYAFAIYTYDDEQLPEGPVTFETTSFTDVTPLPTQFKDGINTNAGTMINNIWFVSLHKSVSNEVTGRDRNNKAYVGHNLSVVDRETGECYATYPCDINFFEMAYNYADDMVYGLTYGETGQELYSIDYKTGETTKLGVLLKPAKPMVAFAIDIEGNAYGLSSDRNFYSIDLTDYSNELIGATGVENVELIQSMAFDHQNGILYWCMTNNTEGDFYKVDITTGKAHFLGNHTQKAEYAAFGFEYGEPKHYLAIRGVDLEGNYPEGVNVNFDGNKKVTDQYGITCYLDLTQGQTYAFNTQYKDKVLSHEVLLDESKKIDVEVEAVSVDENALTSNRIYPNPSNGVLYFNMEDDVQELNVFDLKGNTCLFIEQPGQSLDLAQLENGVYMVQYQTQNGVYTQKIVLRK